jgi:hypothetical protein
MTALSTACWAAANAAVAVSTSDTPGLRTPSAAVAPDRPLCRTLLALLQLLRHLAGWGGDGTAWAPGAACA